MISKKDEAIQAIMSNFEDFANLVLRQLVLLDSLFSEEDADAKAVEKELKENEKQLDRLEVEISEQIVNTITLYQPVASDIRRLIACYRIVISLERVGDLALNIEKRLRKVKDTPLFDKLLDVVSNMLLQAENMVSKALLAFTTSDRDCAIWAIKNDALVDEMNRKMLKKAIKKSKVSDEDKEMLTTFMNMNTLVSSIERIGDHATNIAEAAVYSIDGKDLRHVGNVE